MTTAVALRSTAQTDLAFVRECAVSAYGLYVVRIGREPAPMVADFDAHLADGDLHLIVDAACGDRLGYSVHRVDGNTLFVENIAIRPEHQGTGTGRATFDLLAQLGRDRGAARIELYTNAKMTEALTFYEQLGFAVFDRRLEDGFDRVYLRRPL